MSLSHRHRVYLRRLAKTRAVRIALFLFCVLNFLDVLRIHHNIAYEHDHHHVARTAGRNRERIYIASMHFNDANIMNRWSKELLSLINTLGADNVFVSIYESGSWDNTKEHLRALDSQLENKGVQRRVVVSDVTHKDEMSASDKGDGWILTSRGKKELRRIPYLSKLRNKTIKDLVELNEKGITFDKVLFLNDVIFSVDDVLTLMDTNGGDYGAACSLDFSKPPLYYDTFALRDSGGNPHLMQTWPYFRAQVSRNALINNRDAVPVTSCWNGIVVMPAEPFVSSTKLRFRGVPDSLAKHHLEGSECCLIHADNPLSKTLGVYLNPRVRVGYNVEAYEATHTNSSWVSTWDIFWGLWVNRIKRWTTYSFDAWTAESRIRKWKKEDGGNHEPGVYCLINEMQVLVENGWAHV